MSKSIKFPDRGYEGPGLITTLELERARLERIAKLDLDDYRRMLDLCIKFNIDLGKGESIWYDLALILARELYPEPKKKGRKTKWTQTKGAVLVVEMERLMGEKEPSKQYIQSVAYELSKQEPWKSFIEAKESGETSADPGEALRKVYFSFKNKWWTHICRDGFQYHVQTQDIEGWDQYVIETMMHNDSF